jgi:Zn-dependent protease
VRLDLSWFAGLAAVALSGAFAVTFFACVLVHELAHALVARAIGVPTAEIRLFVFGGAARIRGEPADPGGEALVAMAGPLASVTLAGLLGLFLWQAASEGERSATRTAALAARCRPGG